MQLLEEFLLRDKCSYLDDKEHTMHYKIIQDCNALECQDYIERGYRRFGKAYFRPICEGCDECKSIKIDVNNFNFSSSQKRVLKKASKFNIIIQEPTMSQEHLNLFEKYHLFMKDKKGWKHSKTNPKNYHDSFVNGHNGFGYEVLYYDGDTLIGVDLIDILQDGISSIYFYYDPDYAKYSLGKLSLLIQIKFALEYKKEWIYLGYYVSECSSLSYKADYKPFTTLQGRPLDDESYVWV